MLTQYLGEDGKTTKIKSIADFYDFTLSNYTKTIWDSEQQQRIGYNYFEPTVFGMTTELRVDADQQPDTSVIGITLSWKDEQMTTLKSTKAEPGQKVPVMIQGNNWNLATKEAKFIKYSTRLPINFDYDMTVDVRYYFGMHQILAELGGLTASINLFLGFFGFYFMYAFYHTLAEINQRRYGNDRHVSKIAYYNDIIKHALKFKSLNKELKALCVKDVDIDLSVMSYSEIENYEDFMAKMTKQICKDLGQTEEELMTDVQFQVEPVLKATKQGADDIDALLKEKSSWNVDKLISVIRAKVCIFNMFLMNDTIELENKKLKNICKI